MMVSGTFNWDLTNGGPTAFFSATEPNVEFGWQLATVQWATAQRVIEKKIARLQRDSQRNMFSFKFKIGPFASHRICYDSTTSHTQVKNTGRVFNSWLS